VKRRALLRVIQFKIMDEKHYSLPTLLATVAFLAKLHQAIVDAPHEDKFRRVRGAAVARRVHSAPAADELLRAAGWRPEVVANERFWAQRAAPGGAEWRLLEAAAAELARAAATLEAKMKRSFFDKKGEEARRRGAVAVALEEDRAACELRAQGLAAIAAAGGVVQASDAGGPKSPRE
jgi:hypothetical protein